MRAATLSGIISRFDPRLRDGGDRHREKSEPGLLVSIHASVMEATMFWPLPRMPISFRSTPP